MLLVIVLEPLSFFEGLVPTLLQCAGHQSMRGIDLFIAPLG
jgi:hypothetical protein